MTERTVTHSDLSLPCGCIVTVWPHGRGPDAIGIEAAITGKCRAHSTDVAATIRAWRAETPYIYTEAEAYDRVLRLLEPEGKP